MYFPSLIPSTVSSISRNAPEFSLHIFAKAFRIFPSCFLFGLYNSCFDNFLYFPKMPLSFSLFWEGHGPRSFLEREEKCAGNCLDPESDLIKKKKVDDANHAICLAK